MSNLEKQQQFFPYLADKAVIDFVNGLEVMNDRNSAMKGRSGLGSRLLDSLSGKNHMHQTAINESIQDDLTACLGWLHQLNEKTVEHAYAIQHIKGVLDKHSLVLDALTNHVLEIKESFKNLNNRVDELDKKLNGISLKVYAQDQLNKLVTAWKANDENFKGLSVIEKVYYVLENLAYGPFNAYLMNLAEAKDTNTIEEEKKHLKNSLVECINLELNVSGFNSELPISRRVWIANKGITPEKQEVLEYLGSRSCMDNTLFPITFLASQWNALNTEEREKANVNHIISPDYLIASLQKEVGILGGVQ
jgi:hypothetical protein